MNSDGKEMLGRIIDQANKMQRAIDEAPPCAEEEVRTTVSSPTGLDYVLHLMEKVSENLENVNRHHRNHQ